MYNPKGKGQIALNDALIGFFIFIIIMLTLNNAWQKEAISAEMFRSTTEMQLQATATADLFVKTKGSPENWEIIVQKSGPNCNNEEQVKIIGLAKTENILDQTKVDKFVNCITYDRSVAIMMLDRFDYNFTLSISDGRVFTKGFHTLTQKRAVSVKRFVDFNGLDANLHFTLIEK